MDDTKELLQKISDNIIKTRLTPWVAFRNGVLGGLGAVLGATLVLAILIGILKLFSGIPVVGDISNTIVNTVQKK